MKTANVYERGPYAIRPVSAIGKMRLHLGLTKREAAVRCRVSLRTYERAEAGDVVAFSTKRSIERSLGIGF